MLIIETNQWRAVDVDIVRRLQAVYRDMLPTDTPVELSSIIARMDDADAAPSSVAKLALVAEADGDHRGLATALLEETELDVIECASAEAALAILVNEADKTVFILVDRELAGVRDGNALVETVRLLWPGIHVALATQEADTQPSTDSQGVVRLSRPWRGLDVLIEAERALARAA